MRRTISRIVEREGVGVHSGQAARCVLRPASSGAGLVFATGATRLPALQRHVTSRQQRTVLTDPASGARIETIEHVLAACYGLAIDDLIIEVIGPELPILDGSALPWCIALQEAGLCQHVGTRAPIRPFEGIQVGDGNRWARLQPGSGLTIDITVDFPDPGIGMQRLEWAFSTDAFLRDIAPARTFGAFRDLDRLRAAGLGLGASLENTIAFEDGRVLNPEGLRFHDEPVRHKVLDVLGDLALLGAPLEGRLTMMRPGHALTGALMEQILAMGGR